MFSWGTAEEQSAIDNKEYLSKFYKNIDNKFSKVKYIEKFDSLVNFKFTKKYNLIFKKNDENYYLDPNLSFKNEYLNKQIATDCLMTMLRKNPDKFFLIIDELQIFDIDYSSESNAQIWHRQFQFNQQYLLDSDIKPIENKKHWFGCILGRTDYFRTVFFEWFIKNNLHKNNLISYGCYDAYDRNVSTDTAQNNFKNSSGNETYKKLIPFNNFEKETPKILANRSSLTTDFVNCFANIIFETFGMHSDTNFLYFSERSYKPFIQGNYPIIISSYGSMSRMASKGFIIPDYINWQIWDYLPMDQLHFSTIDIICNQLKELFEKYKLEDIQNDWYPYAIKNYERMHNFKDLNEKEEKTICNWIRSACQ